MSLEDRFGPREAPLPPDRLEPATKREHFFYSGEKTGEKRSGRKKHKGKNSLTYRDA
jgi:hypothetical protein